MLKIRLLRPLIHFLTIIWIFFLVYKLRSFTDWIPLIHLNIPYIDFKETMIFAVLSAFLFVFLWLIKWLYKLFGPIHNYYNKFLWVFIIWFIVITFLAYFWHGYIFPNGISRLIILWWVFFSFFTLIVVDFIINWINSKFETKKPYKIWIYKWLFLEDIKNKFKWYKIYKIESFDNISEINNFDIIFLVWNINPNEIEDIMDEARIKQVEVYHIPDVNFMEDILYHQERLWPIISWKYKPSPLEWWWKVFKRIFDVLFALIFIILFWWVYVIIALRIYFHDKWNIFYISERIWRGWKPFKMYKFRTMVMDADKIKKDLMEKNEREWWILFKLTDDPRVKPWWKILRKTSLDEIPQFFNVLKWDMSIAWPRPHLDEEVKQYKKWQKRLLAAKPWITGYAQVFWRDLPFDEEARLDLYRFQNWSIWMDIVVILWVFRTLFKGD